MKNKEEYINELLSDDSFISYILDGKVSGQSYWQDYRKSDPVKEIAFREAEKYIMTLHSLGEFTSHNDPRLKEKISASVKKDALRTGRRRKSVRMLARMAKIAAAVILPVLAFTLYQVNKGGDDISTQSLPADPGNSGVRIVLANGDNIFPESMSLNDSVKDAGTMIKKTGTNTLKYNLSPKEELIEKITYNTVVVPRGKRYNIELPDGSKAWINSGSELKFPVQFAGNTRQVFLKGEAFFDVRHDEISSRFIVSTTDLDVKVYGTSFNISAYDDDELTETTLVQGSISLEVSSAADSTAYKLEPGEKAGFKKTDSSVDISKVDVRKYTSWKDGYLVFRDEAMASLGPKIGRWYDVTIKFGDPGIEEMRFSGIIREEKSLEHIMTLIRNACKLDYTLEGKELILYRKDNIK